jgi:hypothetical protein
MKRWVVPSLILLGVSLAGLALVRTSTANGPQLKWHNMFLVGGVAAGTEVSQFSMIDDNTILTSGLMSDARLRSRNGQITYTFQPYEVNETPYHVAVSDSGLFCIGTNKNQIYLIDKTGKLLWQRAVPGTRIWTCVPAFGPHDNVYVGSSEGVVWSFDVNGKQRWVGSFPGISGISPISVSSDGTVYGLGRDLSLTAISNDGKQLWRTAPRMGGLDAPLIGPDGGPTCVETLQGKIRHFSKKGDLLWEYAYQPGNSIRDHALSDKQGNVYVNGSINMGNNIIAVNPSGQLKWYVPCGALFSSLGVDTKGRVWLSDDNGASTSTGVSKAGIMSYLHRKPNGYLRVFDGATGKILGKISTPFYFSLVDQIVSLKDDMVMLGEDGQLYCYGMT